MAKRTETEKNDQEEFLQMSDYSVGRRCTGRIIGAYRDIWTIELEHGVIGCIINTDPKAVAEYGATLEVQVKQNDGNGIVLQIVPPTEEKKKIAMQARRPGSTGKTCLRAMVRQ